MTDKPKKMSEEEREAAMQKFIEARKKMKASLEKAAKKAPEEQKTESDT